MGTELNRAFTLGETWQLDFDFSADLTGGQVEFRLGRRGVLQLAVSTPAEEIALDSPVTAGAGSLTIPPALQAEAQLIGAVYQYELRAVLADDSVITAQWGALTARGSLFVAA